MTTFPAATEVEDETEANGRPGRRDAQGLQDRAPRAGLADLCEPMFLAVCRFNRAARLKTPLEMTKVRPEVEALFRAMAEQAAESRDPALPGQYREVRPALVAFVDDVISNSALPFAKSWPRLGHQENEFALDEKFFDLLDKTLGDPSEQATERLGIYYTCLGLGYYGMYRSESEPEALKTYVTRITARIGSQMDVDPDARISKQPYQHTDTRVLQSPTGVRLGGLAIAVVGLVIVAFIVNGLLYYKRTNQLRDAVKKLADPAAAQGD